MMDSMAEYVSSCASSLIRLVKSGAGEPIPRSPYRSLDSASWASAWETSPPSPSSESLDEDGLELPLEEESLLELHDLFSVLEDRYHIVNCFKCLYGVLLEE